MFGGSFHLTCQELVIFRGGSEGEPLVVEEFLKNEEFKAWLQHTHCSQVSDGGAAAIFVSEDGCARSELALIEGQGMGSNERARTW